MTETSRVDHEAIFRGAPVNYIVVDTEWTIIDITDAFGEAVMRRREDIVGANILEAFPNNPDEPGKDNVNVLRTYLERTVKEKVLLHKPLQRYDVKRPTSEGGGWDVRYWRPFFTPVFDADGDVKYIIHGITDVTSEVDSSSAE